MIFNMSGGGTALNFNVVGSTSAPSNPKENTIWVNTNTEVSGYIFANKDPNLLNVADWAANVGMYNGTKTVANGSITITSNDGSFCYTLNNEGFSEIPCTAGKTYLIQWDYSGYDSNVQVFPHYDTTNGTWAYSSACKLEYTVPDGVEYFSFIFGTGGTTTYSNIRITEKELAFDTGAVWIHTGVSSPAKFNALKKNGIIVYPIAVKQFVGGTWSSVTAKSYQGGQWVDWTMYLYNKGVEYVDENGRGWAFSGTYTKNANNIRVGATGGTAYSGYAESGYIEMAGFNSVELYVISYQNSGSECYSNIAIIDESGSTVAQKTIYNGSGTGSNIVISVDVSTVTSKCKVRITAGHTRTGSGRAALVDFDIVRCY